MSTLNALAQKHNISVPHRVADCPQVLNIVMLNNQMLPDGEGGRIATDVLTGRAANGTIYTVRLNVVTVGQLVRIFGPNTEIEGRRVLASTFEKGDRTYIAFNPAPAAAVTRPTFLPGAGEGTAPVKHHETFELAAETLAAIDALNATISTPL